MPFWGKFQKNDPYLLKGGHFTANYDHLITFNGENLLGGKIPPPWGGGFFSIFGKSQIKYQIPPQEIF